MQKRATGSKSGKSYIGHKTWLVEKTATSPWLVNARRTRFLKYYIEFTKKDSHKIKQQKKRDAHVTRVLYAWDACQIPAKGSLMGKLM